MGKSKTTGKGRLDRFYYLAKEQGFRSRAAFKLVQLDRKYRFLSSARSILDLCAAPGGWMQVAVKNMPVGSLIVGVDLVPIRPIRGALSLQEDITTSKCRASLKKVLKEKGYSAVDVVLHDGSPNVGGAWTKEASSQASLVLDSLRLATDFLAPGGTFVTKVFRSQDYNSLLYAFKQLFGKVEVTKPVASRATSAEIYVIGLKYKAPSKIDPRLLDAKHLFEEIVEPEKTADVLRGSKQKRHREGYEEGNTTLRKECSAAEFVWAIKPLDLLGTVTAISFKDSDSAVMRDHPLTKEEVKICCEDLRVLGKQEFKQLLKWRLQIRKALAVPEAKEDTEEGVGKVGDGDEEGVLAQMEELKELMEANKKRQKKLLGKRKAKIKARTATGMQVDVMEDAYVEADLFSLGAIKAKKELEMVEDVDVADDEGGYSSQDEMLNGMQPEADNSDLDSDEEKQRYDAELDEYLEHAYEKFRAAKDGSTKRRKRARLADVEKDSELWQENGEDSVREPYGNDLDAEVEDVEKNPLVVALAQKVKPSKEQLAQQWFSQDVFDGVDAANDISDDEMDVGISNTREETDVEELVRKEPRTTDPQTKNGAAGASSAGPDDADFEIVPAEATTSTDDSSTDEEADYDTDDKAETLAYAKRMLRKRSAEDILDDAYNRYTFNDEGLPRWFAEDEKKHMQAQKPITKEEVEAMKAQFREINARPVKKVAEAKARKKRRAVKKLEAVRQKATAIADQSDLSAKSKNSMMDKLYKKALAAPKKPKRELVVAKKGVGARAGKGRVIVDRRMKKDERSKGSGKPGKGGARKGKTGKGVGKGKGKGKGAPRGGSKGGRKPVSKKR